MDRKKETKKKPQKTKEEKRSEKRAKEASRGRWAQASGLGVRPRAPTPSTPDTTTGVDGSKQSTPIGLRPVFAIPTW